MTLPPQLAQQCLEALEGLLSNGADYTATRDAARAAATALREALASGEGDEARDAAPWHAAVQKEAEDSDLPTEVIEGIFMGLLPAFMADKEEAGYITLPLDRLIENDSYGVWGSDFYRCRVCDGESGAGMLNTGIKHDPNCPLHEDARAAMKGNGK